MTGNKKLGTYGEGLAADYLIRHGWKICERGFRTREGEVDIIAARGRTLAFVEVKTRRSQLYGTPEEAVDSRKQRRIRRAALAYLARGGHDYYQELTFAVIAISIDEGGQALVKFIPDAF